MPTINYFEMLGSFKSILPEYFEGFLPETNGVFNLEMQRNYRLDRLKVWPRLNIFMG